jgi:hypothetical protein
MTSGSRRITHREVVAAALSSTTFAVQSYALNPGLPDSFPWLSTQASGWEQYCFHRLKFEYVTRCSTATAGSFILSPEYDPTDPPPASALSAANVMDSVEDAVWKDMACDLNIAAMYPLGPRKFIRTSRIAGDIRTYDSGTFHLCAVTNPATGTALGNLWVEYDVELFVPQTLVAAPAASSLAYFRPSANVTYTSTVSRNQTFATVVVDSLDWGAPAGGTTWTPPAGAYNVYITLRLQDNTAEEVTSNFFFRKNGVAVEEAHSHETFVAGGIVTLQLDAYVSVNGSDTVDVYGDMTGAAGTLAVYAGGSTFRVIPA